MPELVTKDLIVTTLDMDDRIDMKAYSEDVRLKVIEDSIFDYVFVRDFLSEQSEAGSNTFFLSATGEHANKIRLALESYLIEIGKKKNGTQPKPKKNAARR